MNELDKNFASIDRLPPYIFEQINTLKMEARRNGEDIIDFSMGNPDGETPKFIVDKMTETVQRGDTHRYSQSIGIPKLRLAIADNDIKIILTRIIHQLINGNTLLPTSLLIDE